MRSSRPRTRRIQRRGCCSNLTQETTPHLQARPLRPAVYWRMNYGPVLERLAHWDHSTGETRTLGPQHWRDSHTGTTALERLAHWDHSTGETRTLGPQHWRDSHTGTTALER